MSQCIIGVIQEAAKLDCLESWRTEECRTTGGQLNQIVESGEATETPGNPTQSSASHPAFSRRDASLSFNMAVQENLDCSVPYQGSANVGHMKEELMTGSPGRGQQNPHQEINTKMTNCRIYIKQCKS